MFIKKRGYTILILLLILPTVVALSGTFYWYDAQGVGAPCYSITKPGEAANTYLEDPFPFQIADCCDFEGVTSVKYCVDGTCSALKPSHLINWDGDWQSCQCHQKTWFNAPSKYEAGTFPSCCGDDTNEYYITYLGRNACCTDPNSCVDARNKCGYEIPEATCSDGVDNDCDSFFDCDDPDCRSINTEQYFYLGCRNGIDDDCDGCYDCSDSDCALSLDCVTYRPENCTDGIDNDGDNNIDCQTDNRDLDCVRCFGTNWCGDCEDPPETECADNIDNDCDGKKDCSDTDCIDACVGICMPEPENPSRGNCGDGVDNDCDNLIDYLDPDCLGCPRGTRLCADGTCKEVCVTPQGCVGEPNGNCGPGEGCACDDCSSQRDGCERELICNPTTKICTCPAGTRICPDGKCRVTCHVCGNGLLEVGEECDGTKFGTITQCTDIDYLYNGGVLSCSDECLLDTSKCVVKDSDGDGMPDWWELENNLNPNSDGDKNLDPDGDGLTNWEEYLRGTDPNKKDTDGDTLDDGEDPCPLDPTNQCVEYKDSDDDGMPDWWELEHGLNPNNPDDADDDPDLDGLTNWEEYLRGTDPNKKDTDNDGLNDKEDSYPLDPTNTSTRCGNNIIEPGETCDGTNLDGKTCATILTAGFEGDPVCFAPEDDHACHFDTNDCYFASSACSAEEGAPCTAEKDCSCTECIGQTDGCGYGSICDITAKCACLDGTTLCSDSTCSKPCIGYDRCGQPGYCALPGEKICLTEAQGGTASCDPGEGCGCADCEGKKGPCSYTSVCVDGICTGCFLTRAYWLDPKRETGIDCIGGGNDIKLVVEGNMACDGKTINFTIHDKDDDENGKSVTSVNAIFEGLKATATWTAANELGKVDYYFIAKLSGGDAIGGKALNLEVKHCVPECDKDCDGCCDGDQIAWCKENYPEYCGDKIDENPNTPWCEEVDENCLSAGQSTCVALYDCTSGWWERQGERPSDWPASGTQYWDDAYIKSVLEWGECGEGEPTNRYTVQSENRYRLICPPNLDEEHCCACPQNEPECQPQANCYCKIPEEAYCRKSYSKPMEEKNCLAEEKFPFFTNINILIAVLILIGFYTWQTRTKNKTKKGRARAKK